MHAFSLITALMQLISLITAVLLIATLISAIRYFSWKKKHDAEMGKKLDRVIELLGKERS
ncbi:DUF4083 family protein [Paenibacillus sp. GCM10027628]|uniref:DUF4083 family protein n=1 Tax=Paenibacillus sp. GCM10027628 TaxID=3273413 RepID=UPI003640540B